MAKSYYILESKKVNGTSERDTTWEVKLISKNVTETVADLFYDYLAQEMGTLSYFKVSDEIKALRQANKTSRQTALGILAGKIGSFDILIGYVDHATKRLNNDLIADIERILDDVIFLNEGQIVLAKPADELRREHNASVDEIFRRMFRC